MDFPSIPPGFEPLAPFTLKKVEANEMKARYSASSNLHESRGVQMETEFESSDDGKKSLRHKPSINYGHFDNSSGEESDFEQNQPIRTRLPKGVIRGCEQCSSCQKVTAQWRPEEARRPNLEDAPVFHPTEEEFEDTLKYIASIRSKAEAYGICRIVPPPSWRPPCPLKDVKVWESSKFTTRVQRIDKLQNRDPLRKIKINYNKKIKRRRCMKNGVDHGIGNGEIGIHTEVGNYEAESFGFEPGPDFTLDAFQKYADDFKAQYFRKTEYVSDTRVNSNTSQWEPSIEDIEGEYWRMVEKPTVEIEVLYGADLETGVFGSGFPKCCNQVGSTSEMKYVSSGWNLNNFPRLPGSVLSYESSDISGVLVPWLYVGMCFSSFCWHVEDHHLYSTNYMHWGAPKMWYGIPGADALKLESAMRKHLPDLFEEQPDLLHKLVTQLSPSILMSEGVPLYRCVQNAGEFVVTFPRAYHAGFNCGFNCAEAVNVAPIDWLPHGQNAIELYREQGRKTSISHDKLLLGAARDAVKAHWELNLLRKNTSNNLRWKDVCGTDGILSKTLKTRVEMERVRREFLCKSSRALKMESTFDATSERECGVCFFDLHLSAAGCQNCSPDKYACLNHAKQLCSCSWGAKFFLFRYDINELNVLVEALEGKLGAIYRWARLDLGLALSSYISKESLLVSRQSGKFPNMPGSPSKNMSPQLATASVKEEKENEIAEKPHGGLLALKKTQVCSVSYKSSQEVEEAQYASECKEEVLQSAPDFKKSVSQLAQEKSQGSLALETTEVEKPSVPGNDFVLISDDEGEESSIPFSKRTKDTSEKHISHSNGTETPVNFVDKQVRSTNQAVVRDIINCSSDTGCKKENSIGKTHLDNLKSEMHLTHSATEYSCHRLSSSIINSDKTIQNFSSAKASPDPNQPIAGNCLCLPRSSDGLKPNNEHSQQKLEADAGSRSMDDTVPSASNNSPGCQHNPARYYHQIGPRVAKMVRRINCNVEPLEFGDVKPGNLWCDSRAIYPKGFRSRVRYINATDPANMCYYVSQILDAGRDRPLFMVFLEHCTSEVFVHSSAGRCWEMVRDRVNQEITKQHKLGKRRLPPLQPPGSLDGMEMFGFSSPAIMQVIQGMDRNRICTAYWKSRPLMQITQHSQSTDNLRSSSIESKNSNNNDQPGKGPPATVGTDTILNGLFKKSSLEELQALYSILTSNTSTSNQAVVSQLLLEEISKRSR